MNFLEVEQIEKLTAAFDSGFSIRRCAMVAGVDRKTATRYFGKRPEMLCACGKPQSHKEPCIYRLALGRWQTSKIDPAAVLIWDSLKAEAQTALTDTRLLARVDNTSISELRRFYDPSRRVGFEGSKEAGTLNVIPVQEAEQEQSSSFLFAALERLHPAVKKFVVAITEGASLEDAARESALSERSLQMVMPKLKIFLKPYLAG